MVFWLLVNQTITKLRLKIENYNYYNVWSTQTPKKLK